MFSEDYVILNPLEFLSEDTATKILGHIVCSPIHPLEQYTPSIGTAVLIKNFERSHHVDFSRVLTDTGLQGTFHEWRLNAHAVYGVKLHNHAEIFERLLEQPEVILTLNGWKLGLRENLYLAVGFLSADDVSFTRDTSISAIIDVPISPVGMPIRPRSGQSEQFRVEGRRVFAIQYRPIKRRRRLEIWRPLGENIQLTSSRLQNAIAEGSREQKRLPTSSSNLSSNTKPATEHESSFPLSAYQLPRLDLNQWSLRSVSKLASDNAPLSTSIRAEQEETVPSLPEIPAVPMHRGPTQSSTGTKTTELRSIFDSATPYTRDTASPPNDHQSSKEQLVSRPIQILSLSTDETDRQSVIYSIASIDGEEQENRLDRLVNYLVEQVVSVDTTIEILDNLLVMLPDLLRSFAVRLGGTEPKDKVHLTAMVFIDKHRKEITSKLQARLRSIQKESKEISKEYFDRDLEEWRDQQSDMSAKDKFEFWTLKSQTVAEGDMVDEQDDIPPDDDDDDDIHAEVVLNSNALKWLTKRLHRELTTYYPDPEAKQSIQTALMADLTCPLQLSRRSPPATYTKCVTIPWDLAAFVKDQAMGLQNRGWNSTNVISLANIEHAITITGSAFDAQAMTCIEYLEKTWPELGGQVLCFVKEVINKSPNRWHDSIFQDGTKVSGTRSHMVLDVTLIGNIYAIAEIVEILGWLSSTFQSNQTDMPQYCVPRLESLSTTDSYKLTWTRTQTELDVKSNPCWYKMFHRPTIVDGYPIARRSETRTGLEVSTAIIDALMQRPQVNVFDHKLWIKSFSAMLIPTGRNQDLIKWHYIYKHDGDYLDFLETEVHNTGIARKEDLQQGRHIVGWCPHAKFHTGTPWKEGQSVKRSGLPLPSLTAGIKGFSLTGSYMGAGIALPISLGDRDPPTWIEPDLKSPERKIGHLSRVYMILWDTEFWRGWLVDGVSVLLHLIRASLEHDKHENKSTFLLNMKELLEPIAAYPQAAKEFFTGNNYHNLNLTIFEGVLGGSEETVNDEFTRLWSILAHIAYLAKLDQTKYKEGVNIRMQDIQNRPYLIGWDFEDVLMPACALERRMTVLSTDAEPWVELARSVNTVTLFGKGFGQLIEPDHGPDGCDNWRTVPRDMCYLAAGRYIIQNIIANERPELAQQIQGVSVSGRCRCRTHLQNIVTQNVLKKRNSTSQQSFQGYEGAIIFGSKEPKKFVPDSNKEVPKLLIESSFTGSLASPIDSASNVSNRSTQITTLSTYKESFFRRLLGRGKSKEKI